jgi:hypothetical protein
MSRQSRPEWFKYIRVQKRVILTSGEIDYLISFGPRNICKPFSTEKEAERLREQIVDWLEMWMSKAAEVPHV